MSRLYRNILLIILVGVVSTLIILGPLIFAMLVQP